MKIKEWLNDEDCSFVSAHVGKTSLVTDESEHEAILTISDGNRILTLDYYFATDLEKIEVLHTVRRLKKAISDFYSLIKNIPDEQLDGEKEKECSDVEIVET